MRKIFLEKIPHLLPKNRWRLDEHVLATLAHLHQIEIPNMNFSLHGFEWTEEMSKNTLSFFERKDQNFLCSLLTRLQTEYRYLFEKRHMVSGDPNPLNWGVREDGSLVLFDWERVGLGTPALDLMGVVFGEPDDSVFYQISKIYLKYRWDMAADPNTLMRETQVARVHISSIMLDRYAKGQGNLHPKVLEYFKLEFPLWLKKTFEQ